MEVAGVFDKGWHRVCELINLAVYLQLVFTQG